MAAAAGLPPFPSFDIHSDPSSLGLRWTKWIQRFQNFLIALNIKDNKQKKAMLLHYAGPDVFDVFETLPETGGVDAYDTAVTKLTEYLSPKKNIEYETYVFRQAKQMADETLDVYHTRLRHLAATCEFASIEREIKSQIILSCTSTHLRRRALRNADMTLKELLDTGRAMEFSELHAKSIEETKQQFQNAMPVNSIQHNKRQFTREAYTNRAPDNNKCNNCGGNYPHRGGQAFCPAKGKTCRACGKLNHFEKCCRSKLHLPTTRNPGKQHIKSKVHEVHVSDDSSSKTDRRSSSDDECLYTVYTINPKQPLTKIIVENTAIDVIVDSGASVNIMDETAYTKLQDKVQLQRANIKICTYGSRTALPLLRKINTTLPSLHHQTEDTSLRDTDRKAKQRMKTYADCHNNGHPLDIKIGDTVLYRQLHKGKLSTPFHSTPYQVVDIKGSMLTAENHGHRVTRNSSHFKVVKTPNKDLPAMEEVGNGPQTTCTNLGGGRENSELQCDQQIPSHERHYPSRETRRPPRYLIKEI